jgi:hypothetical protein
MVVQAHMGYFELTLSARYRCNLPGRQRRDIFRRCRFWRGKAVWPLLPSVAAASHQLCPNGSHTREPEGTLAAGVKPQMEEIVGGVRLRNDWQSLCNEAILSSL